MRQRGHDARTSPSRRPHAAAAAAAIATALVAAPVGAHADSPHAYDLGAPVHDIDAAPNGGLVAATGTSLVQLREGEVRELNDISTAGSPINGVSVVGTGKVLAAVGGLDLGVNAAVWTVTRGRAAKVADIEAYEKAHDPDALAGPQWKDPRCEEDPSQGFTAGPQSNPYHLTAITGNEALVADAAGNSVLKTKANGDIELIAVFTPPVDGDGDWRVLFSLPDGTECYVQPVPTSVAVGPDGAYYVGELTGAPAEPGWSRVWRIEPGSQDVTCPSSECHVVVDGLTSVIDLAFGPDGSLYVLEYDENGFLAALSGAGAGGTIKRCHVSTGTCTTVVAGLQLPGAITFDKRGDLWLVENNIVEPVVRRVTL